MKPWMTTCALTALVGGALASPARADYSFREMRALTDAAEARLDEIRLERDEGFVVWMEPDGTTHLAGAVDDVETKRRAADAVLSVPGIDLVVNTIVVHADDVDRPDHEIRGMTRTRMFFDPDVDAEDVTVEVREGVARLDGTVDSEEEARAARAAAARSGAVGIVDGLEVR